MEQPQNNRYSIGVDLGGTNVKFGIISKKGKIAKKVILPTNADKGPDAVVSQIINGINILLENSKIEIKGIGIGTPGTVIIKKGTVENPPNFSGWGKVQLGKIIFKKLGIIVNVENDANAAAIGELIYGAGKKLNNFLMVTLGTGVGGGIIINKQLYRGEHGAAGELGHVSINNNGKLCKCGSRGCVETYLGNNYLISDVKKSLYKHKDSLLFEMVSTDNILLTPKLITEAAIQNDEYAISIIVKAGHALGYSISSVINVLDVTNIVVGGGLAGFGKILFDSLKETIILRVMQPNKDKIKVYPAKLKNNAGIKGAAALVFYKS